MAFNRLARRARARERADLWRTGMAAGQAGNWPMALNAFDSLRQETPTAPRLNYAVGTALCNLDRFEEAAEAFLRETEINPTFAAGFAEYGTQLARLGRAAEGETMLRRGLNLLPNQPDWICSLSLALLGQRRYGEAVRMARRAILLSPDLALAHQALGMALILDGQFDEGKPALVEAARLDPRQTRRMVGLAETFCFVDRLDKSIDLLDTALELDPDAVDTRYYLATVLTRAGQYDRALDELDRVLAAVPDHAYALAARASALQQQGRLDEAEPIFAAALQLRPGDPWLADNVLWAAQHRPGITARGLAALHRQHAERARAIDGLPRRDFANPRDPERLPIIGLVSADLHRHAVASLTLPGLEQLRAAGFKLHFYSNDKVQLEDETTRRFQAIATTWNDIAFSSDETAERIIRGHRVDILIDLSGRTRGNRLSLFARRAAPIQLTWAGYVGTTGLDTMDGLIADAIEIPPGEDEHYSETVIRLPDCYVSYAPPPAEPAPAPPPSAESGTVTFGSFSRPDKLNPVVARLWARILNDLPGSTLLLKYAGFDQDGTQRAIGGQFAAAGLDPARVVFEGGLDPDEMRAAYWRVDVALDPLPYSGGVTTLEALWMGVPVVTLRGDTFAGRHSATYLSAIGQADLIARSDDDYVRIACDLARAPERLAWLRGRLRTQLAESPVCDAKRFGIALADALKQRFRLWCEAEA